jgi:hypothetical protein
LVIIGLVVLLWLVLMGFLFAGTLWFQAYIYTEPVGQLWWRAPAAGTALALFVVLWIVVDYRAVKNNPASTYPYGPLQEMTVAAKTPEPFAKLYVPVDENTEVEYTREKAFDGQKTVYVYRHNLDVMPTRPPKIIVVENDQKTVFEPDHDAKGQFKTERGQPLFYRDKKGRALREGTFELEPSYRVFPVLLGLFLNGTFLALWFVCLWLLLRFQLWHALGLAVALYVVMLLFVIGPVMSRAEDVARPKPAPQGTSLSERRPAAEERIGWA